MTATMVVNCVAVATLICALLGTGSSQRISSDSRAPGNRPTCSTNQFTCRNGECIASELLCDGRADCQDQSDETQIECTKPELTCPDYAFRCSYGACVNGDAPCNGVMDCIDNSDELLPRCPTVSVLASDSNCQEDDMQCKNGQCIGSTLLCDGTVDCRDGSDETLEACGSFQCSQLVFRCNYGACIDGDLPCNGVQDCADASDEAPGLCGGSGLVPTQRPTPRPPTTSTTVSSVTRPPPLLASCTVPPQPQNGQWKMHRSVCDGPIDCDVPPGASLEPGTPLVFTCAPGYTLRGRGDVYCSRKGNWSALPVCIEIRCPTLNSPSRTTTSCTLDRNEVECHSTVLPKTKAKVYCKPGYAPDGVVYRREDVTCSAGGTWEPDPIRCIPVCGQSSASGKPLVVNGARANITAFPWHATLYKEKRNKTVTIKEFICGGTIIDTKVVMTAAHCIFNENTKRADDPSLFYVSTGNIWKDYNHRQDNPLTLRTGKVKNIHIQCQYHGLEGRYAADIALLELEEPFPLSAILAPACLDVHGRTHQILEPGAIGRVAGFGRTESGETSTILQTIDVPYVSYTTCSNSRSGSANADFIGPDKFCAGYNNGTAVCDGDSGGGLVFPRSGLWYVMGIVSVGLGVATNNGERSCDIYSYALYTRVSNYVAWIQDVLGGLERNNFYPPCGKQT